MERGCLVALEGIDGAGTTSQVGPVATRLRAMGISVTTTHEPSDGPVGRLARQALCLVGETRALPEACLALLFAADRLAHLQSVIEPALARGEVVLTDRYLWSSLAYQSAALAPRWVRTLNALARPADINVLLDVPVRVAERRRAARGSAAERYDDAPRQRAAARRYRALCRRARSLTRAAATAVPSADAVAARVSVHRIDASRPLAEITHAIVAALLPWLEAPSRGMR